ncbi:MAG TPA: DUF4199 domain-containing protein [Thermoanaerobaculia bacterium]|jgi:hypothetical protein
MKRIVLIFGVISGLISSALMFLTLPFMHDQMVENGTGYIVGYTSIFLSFLLVFFGIRSYRENSGGTISFGRGVAVGLLITLISCVFYVASWQVIYYKMMPDFADRYSAAEMNKLRKEGASAEQMAAKAKDMQQMKDILENPVLNVAMTFIEPFPVGLVVTLVSAAVLRKRNPAAVAGVAQTV